MALVRLRQFPLRGRVLNNKASVELHVDQKRFTGPRSRFESDKGSARPFGFCPHSSKRLLLLMFIWPNSPCKHYKKKKFLQEHGRKGTDHGVLFMMLACLFLVSIYSHWCVQLLLLQFSELFDLKNHLLNQLLTISTP